MIEPEESDVTLLLRAIGEGSETASADLLESVYAELRALAGSYFQAQHASHTLQPTALVHEAFMKLIGGNGTAWESRAHFFAVAAKAMRQVLIDHARAKRADKRGGNADRVTLSGLAAPGDSEAFDALDINEALDKLADQNLRQSRVVELRFFGGLRVKEIALVLCVSDRTVELDWRMARAWLRRELGATTP